MVMSKPPVVLWFTKNTVVVFVVASAIATCFLVVELMHNNGIGVGYKGDYSSNESPTFNYRPLPLTPKKQILLIAYGRSGSTFTSALISQHPNIFYVFEPLLVMEHHKLENVQNESVAIVNAFLSCSFPDEVIFALENIHLLISDSTRDFYTCISTKALGISHLTCFMELLEACRKREATFVKSIRFRVKWAEQLLKNNPEFKLLYLIRDPRATLYSQARVFRSFDWRTNITNQSQEHCKLLEEDLKEAERLSISFPGQVKGIRYEKGATNPILYTKDIYNFLGLEYNNNILTYVQNITRFSDNDSITQNDYTVFRKNSSQTMDRWRYGAGYHIVREMDRICGHLYPKLGYKKVYSQTDLESQRSLVEKPLIQGLFS